MNLPKRLWKRRRRAAKKQKYVLRLYVAGITPRSQAAIRTVTAICEEHLAGRYDLEVIDIYQQPTLAKGEQIVAVPTLIKSCPCRCANSSAAWRTKRKSWSAWTCGPRRRKNSEQEIEIAEHAGYLPPHFQIRRLRLLRRVGAAPRHDRTVRRMSLRAQRSNLRRIGADLRRRASVYLTVTRVPAAVTLE